MASYQTTTPRNFNVNNPLAVLEKQMSELQLKLDTISVSSPSLRLFLNYPQTNHDYFYQPSNLIRMQTHAAEETGIEETTIPPKSENTLEMFATIPTDLVMSNRTIMKGDTCECTLWCKTTSPSVSISFVMMLYKSLTIDGIPTGVALCNSESKYPLLPVQNNNNIVQPVKHTFTIPMIQTVLTMSPTDQLVFIPTFHNPTLTPITVQTFFGGETLSFLSMHGATNPLPPNQTWVCNQLFTTNVQAACFQLGIPIGDTPIPFGSLPSIPMAMNAENWYFTDTTNYYQHLAIQNAANETGGTSNFLCKITDVYEPDNFAIFQVGPILAGLTGPNGSLFHIMLLSAPIVYDGMITAMHAYSIEIMQDTLGTGAFFGGISLSAFQETLQSSIAPLFQEGSTQFLSQISSSHAKKLDAQPKRKFVVSRHSSYDLQEDEIAIDTTNNFGAVVQIPASIDLRTSMPPIRDQGNLGSCTAFALDGHYCYLTNRSFTGSPLYLYYNERKQDGTIRIDAGSTITSGIRALKTTGLCKEQTWPYIIGNFTQLPTTGAYAEGALHRVITATAMTTNLQTLKTMVASGKVITFGFLVYSSFVSSTVARTGIVPIPKRGEQLLGGHAVTIVGYNDAKQWFIVRNSWGSAWGDKGYFYMPYGYVSNTRYSWDFWSIQSAT